MNSAIPRAYVLSPQPRIRASDRGATSASSPSTGHPHGRQNPMSVNEIHLTVVGRIGSEPDFKEIGQVPHLSFRLASTPRQFDKVLGRFVEKTTSWLQVECWRYLAQNAFDSTRIGQPVIVSGKLRTHEWTDDKGEQRSRLVLEAFT